MKNIITLVLLLFVFFVKAQTITINVPLDEPCVSALYTIEVNALPYNGGELSGGGEYNYGDTASVTALINAGYTFINWTEEGNEVSGSETYSFTVIEHRNLTANFSLNEYEISTSSNPSEAGTVSGGGSYHHGETVNVTVETTPGFTFINWTEEGNEVSGSETYSFTATEDRNLTANFSLNEYEISTSSNPSEAGTVSGGGSYHHGETVSVTVETNPGFTFVNWTEEGNEVSAVETYSFTAAEDRNLTANFSLNEHEISTISNPSEGGTISGSGSYAYGDTANLTAEASEGYIFVNWIEADVEVSTDEEYSFTVEENRFLTANFDINVSVNKLELEGVTLYPNPFEDQVLIKSQNKAIQKFQIFDVSGKLITEQKGTEKLEMEVDVSFLSSGTYLIKVYMDEESGVFKMIKN